MANSSMIGGLKKKIVKELIKDKTIVNALNSKIAFCKSEDLINNHIFDYEQNPFTINKAITFITIEVLISEKYLSNRDNTYVKPRIVFNIYSHYSRMVIDDIPKITQNRNDYIAELIDKKFNGREDFGIGKMVFKSNIGGSFQKDYLYRTVIFETTDLNNSLCEVE